ncbi:MAG: DEAD/DEAH box helicase [Pirellulaceae bacterium]
MTRRLLLACNCEFWEQRLTKPRMCKRTQLLIDSNGTFDCVCNSDLELSKSKNGKISYLVTTTSTKTRRQKLSFDHLGLSDAMLESLANAGYERPTPIQAAIIPLALEEIDLIGQAQTGTGKTAAFGIPLLEMIEGKSDRPKALILAPTRELAVQVSKELQRLSTDESISIVCLYGGKPMKGQINQLKGGASIVVGTPGRVIDHAKRGTLSLAAIEFVVLDEADRMLDIGFRDDIEWLVRRCPTDRQTLLLSATLPPAILELAKRYMYAPKMINFSANKVSAETIEQHYFMVHDETKFDVLLKLLERENPEQAIVFCRTKLGTERLYRKLLKSGAVSRLGTIHGDLNQSARDRMMEQFRAGNIQCLVATDVVGRGIDVTGVSHIINFDIPELSDDYVHRVGRTGRMGKTGVAFTFVEPSQRSELAKIERKINRKLESDPLQEWIDVHTESTIGVSLNAPPKSKYRRAL